MNTKHIFAAISVATALAVITPAYAGGLGGHLGGGGGLGGGLSGMSGMNRGLSGQGALQGQGALGGSVNKPNLHPATKAVKQGGSVTGDAAGQAAGSVSKTGTAGAANVAGSTESAAALAKPATASVAGNATSAAAGATNTASAINPASAAGTATNAAGAINTSSVTNAAKRDGYRDPGAGLQAERQLRHGPESLGDGTKAEPRSEPHRSGRRECHDQQGLGRGERRRRG